jgi:mRNA-degrading endonuclease toxin of MazEF toxin-antitoxin module
VSKPSRGQIVWTVLPDPQGRNPKCRPTVVVTPTAEISSDGDMVVVANTSRLDMAAPGDQVELPWHRDGHPRTGLREPSAAVCTWLVRIPSSAIDRYGGQVPTPQMLRILARLDALTTTEDTPPVNSPEES